MAALTRPSMGHRVPTVPQGPFFDPTSANGSSTSWMQPNRARLPIVQNWNFGIERIIERGLLVKANYVGTSAYPSEWFPQLQSVGPAISFAAIATHRRCGFRGGRFSGNRFAISRI